MTRTIKKALTVFLLLCLTMALGAAALASSGSVTGITVSVGEGTAQAGKTITKISVQIQGEGKFAAQLETSAFTVNGTDVGLDSSSFTVSGVEGQGTTTATLTVSDCTPTKAGNITVTANQAAFEGSAEGPFSNTVSVNPAPEVTVTTSDELTAGQEPGSVTFTISGGGNYFASTESAAPNFSITNGNDLGVTLSKVSATGTNTATLTLQGTPTKSGTITVTMQAGAFTYQPSGSTTCDITVRPAATPSVSASASGLVAGTEGTIQLTSTANPFKGSLHGEWFTVSIDGESQTVTSPGDGNSTTTTLSFTPTKAGNVTVKVKKEAFQYEISESEVIATGDPITVTAPTVTATASGGLTQGVAGGKITVTINSSNDTFTSLTEDNIGLFTVKVNNSETVRVTNVSGSGDSATLTMDAPQTTGAVTVEVAAGAFTYAPQGGTVTASGATVTAPTGTVSATLNGDLYAGTEVSGQTITLTANGELSFKEANAGNFELTNDHGGLTIASASGSEKTVTLNLGGKPTTDGDFQVKVKEAAFLYAPTEKDVTTTEQLKVNPAPTVTMKPTSMVAGNANTVEITIETDKVNFASSVVANTLNVTGDGFTDITVTNVAPEGNKATLTLSKTPTTSGQMKIEIPANAFNPVASAAVNVDVTVSKPTGDVTAALSGSPATLTAGKDAAGTQIKISATQTLNFKSTPELTKDDFELGVGSTGLSITDVKYTNAKEVLLTLSGTPEAGGDFTVTAQTSAFVAPPEGAKQTGDLTINYPTVSVSPNPNHLVEDDDTVKTIKLTATGSVFAGATGEATNFSFADYTDITLASVTATEDSSEAILTFTGTPENSGTLTIKVKPAAFKYQPESEVSTTVNITLPTGDLAAKLNGELYAGTPVSGQTISLSISNSQGLHFKDDLTKDAFRLDSAPAGLSISSAAYVDSTHATLTLTGAPTTAGDFTVKALKDKAFKQAPANDLTAKGTFTVSPAPSGTVSAAPSGPLYAGTPADGTTVTLTATGLTFQSGLSADKFTLTGADGLTIKSVSGSGSAVILTLSGTPKAAGVFQVQVANSAFTVYPAGSVTSSAVTVGAANIKLTVSDNGLQAGKKDMTFTVTPSGGKLIDLANRAAAIDAGEDLKGLTLGDMTQNADGSVTVTVMGMPPVAGSVTLTLQPSMFDPQPEKAVSVTVPVAEGEQAAEPETKPGAPGIGFTAPVEDLASAVLTPEEQALYEKGAQVLIELVESPGAQVPEADKTAVAAAAGDYTVGEYLDVSLIKTINGVSGTVSETSKPIQVVFTIPEDLRASGRQFAVIRVHEGKAEFLKTVASTATTITVESDLFSTYAIVYQEAPASTDKPDTTDKPDATPAPTTAPHTGDETPLLGWTALLLGCAAALVLTAAALRRRRDRG